MAKKTLRRVSEEAIRHDEVRREKVRRWFVNGGELTVSEEDEDDEVKGVDHASIVDSSSRLDAIVHHLVPILPRQNLRVTQHMTSLVTEANIVVTYVDLT